MIDEINPPFYDYWFCGNSKTEVFAALKEAEISTQPTNFSSFDPIGIIWINGSDVDEQNNIIQVPLNGWHANLRMSIPLTEKQLQKLELILIPKPQNPVRVWL